MSQVTVPRVASKTTASKIASLEELAVVVARLKKQGKRVAHCHGVFDLLHIGHIRHFQEARRHGDILIVTVTPDRFVNKGAHRPVFPERLRAADYPWEVYRSLELGPGGHARAPARRAKQAVREVIRGRARR